MRQINNAVPNTILLCGIPYGHNVYGVYTDPSVSASRRATRNKRETGGICPCSRKRSVTFTTLFIGVFHPFLNDELVY